MIGRFLADSTLGQLVNSFEFEFLPQGTSVEPTDNVLVLDVGNKVCRGILDDHKGGGKSTCRLVLDNEGLLRCPADVDGVNTLKIVTHKAPDLDAISAVYLCVYYFAFGKFPDGAHTLAAWIDEVDIGRFPDYRQILEGPYALWVGITLEAEQCTERELRDSLILAKGLAVVEEMLSAQQRNYWKLDISWKFPSSHYAATIAAEAYQRDLLASQIYNISLPTTGSDTWTRCSLLVCDSPESDAFFRIFARHDIENDPLKKGFATFVTFDRANGGKHYYISVDPNSRLNLKGLAQIFEKKEDFRLSQFGGETRACDTPRVGYSYNDPWYDDRRGSNPYTIVREPSSGTNLTEDEILSALLAFSDPWNGIHASDLSTRGFTSIKVEQDRYRQALGSVIKNSKWLEVDHAELIKPCYSLSSSAISLLEHTHFGAGGETAREGGVRVFSMSSCGDLQLPIDSDLRITDLQVAFLPDNIMVVIPNITATQSTVTMSEALSIVNRYDNSGREIETKWQQVLKELFHQIEVDPDQWYGTPISFWLKRITVIGRSMKSFDRCLLLRNMQTARIDVGFEYREESLGRIPDRYGKSWFRAGSASICLLDAEGDGGHHRDDGDGYLRLAIIYALYHRCELGSILYSLNRSCLSNPVQNAEDIQVSRDRFLSLSARNILPCLSTAENLDAIWQNMTGLMRISELLHQAKQTVYEKAGFIQADLQTNVFRQQLAIGEVTEDVEKLIIGIYAFEVGHIICEKVAQTNDFVHHYEILIIGVFVALSIIGAHFCITWRKAHHLKSNSDPRH